jgi:UDP-glucose 4-epimerase
MRKKKILVTGGMGYIGSHTIVDLIEKGFDIVCVDNLSRGDMQMLWGVEKILKKKIPYYVIDICNAQSVSDMFEKEKGFSGIIHFAAYKSVNESVLHPLMYFQNNLTSLMNILDATIQYQVPYFIFSSSCSVYGDLETMPVTEHTALGKVASPYALTKRMGEEMIDELSKQAQTKFISLRYFNPAGAHPSALIGELQKGEPENLIPAITQFAAGKIPRFYVHGNDYPTRDGTCIRDYIHVCDIADAHSKALQYLMQNKKAPKHQIINLGSGSGTTVLEAIRAFEKVTKQKLNYTVGPRRAGDVVQIYANNAMAQKLLKWKPQHNISSMMRTAWKWQKKRFSETIH